MHGIESRIDNKHGQAWIFKSLWGQRGASRISLSISVWTRQMIDWRRKKAEKAYRRGWSIGR